MRACALDELAKGTGRAVTLSGTYIALFQAGGRVYALEDRCPHRGARLSLGLIYEEGKVACLDHGWGIRLADGGVEPPERGCVRTFEVKIEDGWVWVLV